MTLDRTLYRLIVFTASASIFIGALITYGIGAYFAVTRGWHSAGGAIGAASVILFFGLFLTLFLLATVEVEESQAMLKLGTRIKEDVLEQLYEMDYGALRGQVPPPDVGMHPMVPVSGPPPPKPRAKRVLFDSARRGVQPAAERPTDVVPPPGPSNIHVMTPSPLPPPEDVHNQ